MDYFSRTIIMSFVKKEKPRLIPNKMIQYFINLREKESKIQFGGSKEILNKIKEFIKINYGFVLIVTLICILLYVRYIEVDRRKEKIKLIMEENKNNKKKVKPILKKKIDDNEDLYYRQSI